MKGQKLGPGHRAQRKQATYETFLLFLPSLLPENKYHPQANKAYSRMTGSTPGLALARKLKTWFSLTTQAQAQESIQAHKHEE